MNWDSDFLVLGPYDGHNRLALDLLQNFAFQSDRYVENGNRGHNLSYSQPLFLSLAVWVIGGDAAALRNLPQTAAGAAQSFGRGRADCVRFQSPARSS